MARRTTSNSTGSSPGPRNRTPQPLPRRRRTVGDFLKAFLAFVALLVLLIGVPGALASQIGWPLPSGSPSLDWLQKEISVDTFINTLTVVVWFAWAQFTACVLVEVKAALSGVGLPNRVPGAGPSQLLARQLVAALLLVGATAASFTPGLSQLGQQLDGNQRPAAAAAQQTPGGLLGQQQEQAASTAAALAEQAASAAAHAESGTGAHASDDDTKFYRIQPPEGRHHDSLWEVAERHLGDGRRYKEIYQLNKDRTQPDGSKLSEASLIRPGWIMEMPGDARGGELVEMPDEAPKVSEEVQQQISDYARTGGAEGAGGQQGGGSGSGSSTATPPTSVFPSSGPHPTRGTNRVSPDSRVRTGSKDSKGRSTPPPPGRTVGSGCRRHCSARPSSPPDSSAPSAGVAGRPCGSPPSVPSAGAAAWSRRRPPAPPPTRRTRCWWGPTPRAYAFSTSPCAGSPRRSRVSPGRCRPSTRPG